MTAASPWDALLKAQPQRRHAPPPADAAKPSTKVGQIMFELAHCGPASTTKLAILTDLETRQVWGLLKNHRTNGQVKFADGVWQLVPGFDGHTLRVRKAAELLRKAGWRVQPPTERTAQ